MLAPPVGRVVHVQEAVSPLVHLKPISDTVATYPADLRASAVPDPDSDTPAQTDRRVFLQVWLLVAKSNWLKSKQYHLYRGQYRANS